ncbi:Uncharacterised protein [uncultured Clostridium sp.]|uniref:hypothetical protein n=1 Tax=uncultured Clostridium sp. TaxID=59620 RepID=UPI00082050E3|nr:hypothetical protein [uncultured Clostridium sp.]SCJ93666.1 Uncharacterised protein [uncultured Clostridium sp.]
MERKVLTEDNTKEIIEKLEDLDHILLEKCKYDYATTAEEIKKAMKEHHEIQELLSVLK